MLLQGDSPKLVDDPGQHSGGGVYVGEVLSPIPQKLAKKIIKGDYVEMEELLPELWPTAQQEGEGRTRSRNQKITDIFTWIQCFSLYTSVRGRHDPKLIAELMAYMVSIVRASREYSDLGWVQYDALFQKHAALRADTRWSVINTTLYARCFTGAPREARCELCWANSHEMKDCLHLTGTESAIESRVQLIEQSIQSMSQRRGQPVRPRPSGEVCRKFNNEGCTYPYCRHEHVCMTCGGPHPELQCPWNQRQGRKMEPRRPVKPY